MVRCFIALGGNVGPVEETFDSALRGLGEWEIRVGRRSSIHQSKPVGARAGDTFRNAAAEIETSLEPLELLERLHAVEDRHGRTRTIRWGPRTLDLDLILYGDRVVDHPRLVVPHPACWYRRFVLDPLVEIAADVVHPVKLASIAALRERLLPRPLRLAVAGGTQALREDVCEALRSQFPGVAYELWAPDKRSGAQAGRGFAKPPGPATPRFGNREFGSTSADPTLLAWLGPDPESGERFEDLPLLPRLDASMTGGPPHDFLRDVLRSALGE